MIVNETATRSRALDEHSRAKMGRQGLIWRTCRGKVIDDETKDLALHSPIDVCCSLLNGYREENRPGSASLSYINEGPEDHKASCDSTSGQ